MSSIPWLTILLIVPAVGALATVLAGRLHRPVLAGELSRPVTVGGEVDASAGDRLAKQAALGFSLLELLGTIVMSASFDRGGPRYQFRQSYAWIDRFGVHYSVAADGISLVLIALTAVLVPVVLLASWNDVAESRRSVPTFFALVLALQALLVGVFAATDVFMFYVFFEVMLIPMYFLIGSYGGPRRTYAAVKFLLYSLIGGLLMLAAVIGLYVVASSQGHPTFDFATLSNHSVIHISKGVQDALFLGFFVAFAVKAPLWPFHTWLPDAGAEGPTGASVMLVGVLDKVGTFGFIRYCIPLFPDASRLFAPYVVALAVVGILYGALVAMAQRDIKRLVSYTSLAHFGFIALGVFAFTSQGGSGAVLYMVNHGLSTGALFLIAGFLIERRRTRLISDYGGIARVTPLIAGSFLIAGLSSLALPGLNAFVSEFLVLVGTFTRYRVAAILATLGIVLAALYILIAYQRMMQGPLLRANEALKDLSMREAFVIAPLLALVIALGVYPKPLLDAITPAVTATFSDAGQHDPAPTAVAGNRP